MQIPRIDHRNQHYFGKINLPRKLFYGHIADGKVVRDCVGRGGVVATKSDLERDFIAIQLKCYARDGARKSKDEIKYCVENFLIP